ncbi:50S ribosomal protein L35ae [Nanoarchaeota archaeon]
MEGTVVSFRRGRYTQKDRHFLIQPYGCDDRVEATKLMGKKVTWTSPAKKEIVGQVSAPHGGKGLVRVIFEKGLPGQAVTTKVKIE